jgi:hypothetical protein
LGEQCKATQQKGSRELMRRHRDVMVIKRGHHKRMLTSEKNGAQEDAYLGEKWSISRLKSKPKTTWKSSRTDLEIKRTPKGNKKKSHLKESE